jgi:hypothetical protein
MIKDRTSRALLIQLHEERLRIVRISKKTVAKIIFSTRPLAVENLVLLGISLVFAECLRLNLHFLAWQKVKGFLVAGCFWRADLLLKLFHQLVNLFIFFPLGVFGFGGS